jgi:predicted adenine nucleotide alpha hydrolase (AANH) superfamily ATPase
VTRLLLHTCCAPCTIHPLAALREEGWEVAGYFYNPNIHPYREWQRRRDALSHYATQERFPVEVVEGYDLEAFLGEALAQGSARCASCYRRRLAAVARAARAGGFDAFSTTLLVSPYQRHDEIRRSGEELARTEGVPFVYRDFRPGFRAAQAKAKQLGVYRQPYCGCIFSEREWYQR